MSERRRSLPSVPIAALVFIGAGGVAFAARLASAAWWIWTVGLVTTGAPLVLGTLRAARRGRFATDIVAMLAIVTAVALGQPFAGLVIVLMQSGGEALERMASERASAAVRELEAAAPRVAHLCRSDDSTEDVDVAAVRSGDELLVLPGELVPVDGVVTAGSSDLDTSRLTGEPMPARVAPGAAVMSGMGNLSGPFHVRATAVAAASQYARIVELVRTAQAEKAPIQRLADQWAVWFTPATILVCVGTFAMTRDWTRVLSVLVVATPCPLILAAPVAIIGGVNRGARRGVIVRNGGALESLSRITTVVFDKTGTLTVGRPRVAAVRPFGRYDERTVLATAAALERASGHHLARVIVSHAESRLDPGDRVVAAHPRESPGEGVRAIVVGRDAFVGGRTFVQREAHIPPAALDAAVAADGMLRTYVAVRGELAGVIEFEDQPRAEVLPLLQMLRAAGVRRFILLSGDHPPAARAIAARFGITEASGDMLPQDKAVAVKALVRGGDIVAMVGDGINDAPALSAASVGVALAVHGGGITAQAADVILLADDLSRLGDAVAIARRTMRIARQSIATGLALSGAAMVVAAFGGIEPAVGALLQEGIDVAVIVNALRAATTERGNVSGS